MSYFSFLLYDLIVFCSCFLLLRQDERLARTFLDKRKNELYEKSLKDRRSLPAWHKMPEILEAVKNFQVVVICGETGCGKSTQVSLRISCVIFVPLINLVFSLLTKCSLPRFHNSC